MSAPRLIPKGDSRDRFGLLVLLLVGVLLLSGVDDSGIVRFLAAMVNMLALLVGFGGERLRRRRWLLIPIILLGVGGGVLVGADRVDGVAGAVGSGAQALMLAGLTIVVLARLLEHEEVTTQTLLGAVAAYMLLGQVFAWVYLAMPNYLSQEVLQPVDGGEIPLYYSYVVLTTLGFGDIQPVSAVAQRVTALEALMGQLFLGILVARLVSLWRGRQRSGSRGEPEPGSA